MADPKTDINESLFCIALRYISIFPNYTEQNFIDYILKEGEKPETWKDTSGGVLENLEIGKGKLKTHSTYRSAYGKEGNESWISGSFRSAKAVKEKLNIDLRDYIISRPIDENNNKSYLIKSECVSAMKNWANVFKQTDVAKAFHWTPGFLSDLKSDKINIADIMLIHKESKIYEELDKMQKKTKAITLARYNKDRSVSILMELLTPKKYNEYMNRAWFEKEIFNISLKKVITQDVPLKLVNLDAKSAAEYKEDIDEFKFLITSLIGAAKSGSLSDFEDSIKKTIDLEPVIFSANDRLEVKYKLKIKNPKLNKVNSYDYTMWTNFGAGSNSVYFSQKGSSSASGEGGIVLNYFASLIKDIPNLKKFILYMKNKRIEYFDASCKKYGVTFNDSKLGESSLSNMKYNSILYTSKDFMKLVHVLLLDSEPIKYYKDKLGKSKTRDNIFIPSFITKNNGEIIINSDNESVRIDFKRMLVLEHFFDEYTKFLSNNNSQMGKYFGLSELTKKSLITQGRKTYQEFEKIYNAASLSKKKVKLDQKQNQDLKKEIEKIKGETGSETIKLKNERISNAISLTSEELNSIKKKATLEARSWKKREYSKFEKNYKKGFALLANAEFGYMYSEYANEINELVKKQVLLSLYAAASGRGLIVFDNKRFEIDDYFEKNVKGSPFLKVGM